MTRTMIIPAAGLGSRLGLPVPKLLAPVAGRPMIDHLLGRYGPFVERFVLVVSPAARDLVAGHVHTRAEAIELAVQPEPTGMLDAILAAGSLVRRQRPERVWITWCDQLAIREETVGRLIETEAELPEPAMVVPICPGPDPYIHFDRDGSGRIIAVRQRREGDSMPTTGESDMGLFSLSRRAHLEALEAYGQTAAPGRTTGERNFLPFIPWLARNERVVTFPCVDPIEAIGINTREELHRIERYLRGHAEGRAHGDDHARRG